jgi:hypothetical protein
MKPTSTKDLSIVWSDLEHLQRCLVCDSRHYNLLWNSQNVPEIGFTAPNSCIVQWPVNGATQLCTSQRECNKLHLTAAQYFWLVDHNDWSWWFAISSPPRICSSNFSFIGGIAKKKTAKLRHLILLFRVTYWALLEMLLVLMPRTPYFKVKWSSILLSIVNSTFFFSFPSFHLIHFILDQWVLVLLTKKYILNLL